MKKKSPKFFSAFLNCKFLKIFGFYIVFVLMGTQNSQAQYTAIPDTHFEQALVDLGIDTVNGDHQVLTSAISGVTTLNLSDYYGMYYGLTDLTGIQDFTALTYLDCGGGLLTSLDVSHNLNLSTLYCYDNSISSLDVSANTNLTQLNIDRTLISTLDVSHNTALTYLSCSGALLNTLDVSANTNLTILDTSLNPISSLNVTANTNLTYLSCGGDLLTNLNINSLVNLTDLYCGTNSLSSIDVSHNTHLINFDCQANQLTNLDVTHNPDLAYFVCSNNLLTNLDVTSNNLTDLYCDNNLLAALNVNTLTNLSTFDFDSNQLTSIDFSHNLNLNFISGSYNLLTSFDISMLPLLQTIFVHNNQLASLNICANTNLHTLFLQNNLLTSLDLRNSSALSYLIAIQNSNLTTIYVNDLITANNHAAAGEWNKDATAAFSIATAVGGTISNNQTICSGTQPTSLTLTGTIGNVVKWQKSTTSDFSTGVTDIENTTMTLSGATIGNLTATTYFRAVVESGKCVAFANSTVTTISMGGNSTWDGTTWIGGTPDSTKNATFNGDKTITSDMNVCSCHVSGTAQVVVNSGVNVTVVNNVTVDSSASLTIQNNANLIQVNESTNNGNITVVRDSAPIIRLDHTLWSTPVTGSQTLQQFSPNTLTNRFYYYNNATDAYSATSSSGVFPIGKAVAIRAANNWVSAPETPWTGTFIGVPNNGIINYSLQNAGLGYNGVGNPYPSCISGSAFVTANSSKITGTLYFYAHTLSMNSSGLYPEGTNYSTWNPGMGGTPATVGGGGTGSNPTIPNGIIEIGQGFIVKATQSGSLEFNNSMRVGNNFNQFFKVGNNTTAVSTEYPIERHRIWLSLSNSNNPLNTILVGYADGATNGVDTGYDGVCLVGTGSYFYSILSDQGYTIQGRSLPFVDTDIVPLGFKAMATNTYTFSLFNTDGLFSGSQDIFILDTLTGITHNLKTSNYTFTSDAGVFENRFYLKYTNDNLNSLSNSLVSNELKAFEKNGVLYIKSTLEELQNIQIFDIQGRKLFTKENLQSNSFQTNEIRVANEVLFVEITTVENHKKIIKVEF